MSRFIVLIIVFLPSISMAHISSSSGELSITKFEFNGITVERTIDESKSQYSPNYAVKVFREDKELAIYKNFTFDYILAFDNGNYIFAGSNSGLSRFAYFVINKNGGLVMAQVHSESILAYCNKGIFSHIPSREWLPEKIIIREQYFGFKGIFNTDFDNYSDEVVNYGPNGVLNGYLNQFLSMLSINDYDSFLNILLNKYLPLSDYYDPDHNLHEAIKYRLDNKSLSVARIRTCNGSYIDFLNIDQWNS